MPVFLLSTISSLMHDMIYSLICSRTSKGLSLGELIRAFCIIIIATYRTSFYCYLHWSFIIYAFLDDLWDFPTKSLVLVFNFWEAENLLFRILMFQGPSGPQLIRGKIPRKFLWKIRSLGQRYAPGATWAPKEHRWRGPGGTAPPKPVWPSSVISAPSFYVLLCSERKPYAIFFW